MNNEEAIRRTKLYLEGLEKAVAQPIPEASAKELDEIIHDPEGDEERQASMCLWAVILLYRYAFNFSLSANSLWLFSSSKSNRSW